MHPALLQDDILQVVFGFISDDRSQQDLRWTYAQLARCCRAWKDPALDRLWEHLHGMHAVLTVLRTCEELVSTRHFKSDPITRQLLIQEHTFQIPEDDFLLTGDEYDDLLYDEGDEIVSYSNPAFQSINEAFKELEQSIRSMEEVPLEIRHLAPASPLLRYTALRVQGSSAKEPADVVLQFES